MSIHLIMYFGKTTLARAHWGKRQSRTSHGLEREREGMKAASLLESIICRFPCLHTHQSVTTANLCTLPRSRSSSHLLNFANTSVNSGAVFTWDCKINNVCVCVCVRAHKMDTNMYASSHGQVALLLTCVIPVRRVQNFDRLGCNHGRQYE